MGLAARLLGKPLLAFSKPTALAKWIVGTAKPREGEHLVRRMR